MRRYKKQISRIVTVAMLFAFLVGNSNMVYAMGATQVGYASKYITVKGNNTLFYDTETGRYDIRFDLESFYGGLHCGECFDVKVKDIWIPVRIEMGDDWYLVGLNVSRLDGLRVRM